MPSFPNPSSQSLQIPDIACADSVLNWLERILPDITRQLIDSRNLDLPILQLPLAQMRLVTALYRESTQTINLDSGESMGQLSARLGVKQNALTQAADRLIARGLAVRQQDPVDRRVVRLKLSGLGCEWVSTRHVRRREHLHRIWEQMEPSEKQEFILALQVLERIGQRYELKTEVTAQNSNYLGD